MLLEVSREIILSNQISFICLKRFTVYFTPKMGPYGVDQTNLQQMKSFLSENLQYTFYISLKVL
jgi:hypothetical protein